MMKIANSISIRVFSKEGEDDEKIAQTLKQLVPFDYEKEKIRFRTETATGFNESKIMIYAIFLEKERHTRKFLELLMGRLTKEQKELLSRQEESRLDESLNFYIRLDKERLMHDEYWITDDGNCYHITISLAAFPRKKEAALKIAEELLSL